MPQLDPTWFASQLFWLVVCFTILYTLLSRLILPPLQGVIMNRKSTIDHDVSKAQQLKSDAELAKQSYEQTLVQSRVQAQDLMNEAAIASKAQAEQSTKTLDAQVAVQLANATKNITEKKQELMANLMPQVSEFSAIIVEKLTNKKPSEEQLKKALGNIG